MTFEEIVCHVGVVEELKGHTSRSKVADTVPCLPITSNFYSLAKSPTFSNVRERWGLGKGVKIAGDGKTW